MVQLNWINQILHNTLTFGLQTSSQPIHLLHKVHEPSPQRVNESLLLRGDQFLAEVFGGGLDVGGEGFSGVLELGHELLDRAEVLASLQG